MAGKIYSGAYPNGIHLSDPGTQETVTVTGTVTNTNADAIYGTTAFPWTVNNEGTIANTGTTGNGIDLLQGGTVNNMIGGLIAGYRNGIAIQGATALVTNLGKIESTGTGHDAIIFGLLSGSTGRVINGSTAVTGALIEGGENAVRIIGGATGAIINFGTMTTGAPGSVVALWGGGSVTNGASTSTAALISGPGTGVYVNYGTGTVTNFGGIRGSAGVMLRNGGVVTNGQAGSTAATIIGTSSSAVQIFGAAGTVTNLATITTTGSFANVQLFDGGHVTNGAPTVTGALITGLGTGVYFANVPGTVTNFGTIAATSTVAGFGSGVALENGGGVVNAGTIREANSSAAGVYLRGGGTVTNTKNGATIGLISSVGSAIVFRGGPGTVTNSGSIQSSAAGIYINSGGTITNQAGGLIAGAGDGIYDRALPISVVNSGTIKTTGNAGIYLRGGGSITNNSGGLIAGGAYGLEIRRQAGIVTNHGTIEGIMGVGRPAGGVGTVTLDNFGVIESTVTNGTAVLLGNSVSKSVLIVEAGSTFIGAVNGGGNAEIEFIPGGTAGMANVFGFSTILLGHGVSHSLTLSTANFNLVNSGRITVLGANNATAVNIVNTVNASAVNTGSVILVGGSATGSGTVTDKFTGSTGSDTFEFSTTTLTAADTVVGNGGSLGKLLMTSAGTVTATGVTGVDIYQLANGGANTLSLANSNFTGVSGGIIRVYGGNAGNTVNGAAVTGSSDQLVIYGGAGIDHLTGDAGNDVFVFTPATLTATDTIAGGAGTDKLLMTAHGTINAGGVSGVENFVLASGGVNTLALTNANFTSVSGATIHVFGGAAGNRVDDSAVTGTNQLVFTGGAGNDIIVAGSRTTMTGGAGTNQFTFDHIGTNSITDFGASATNELVFSNSGFALGFSGATSTPQLWTAPEIAAHFSTGAGIYASTSAGFDYTGGKLFYSATGSSSNQHLVAALSGSPVITAASQLFFVS